MMLEILRDNYTSVSIWLQGMEIWKTLDIYSISIPDIKLISPTLSSYDQYLADTPCDYIGTRLHAGIRACKKREDR